jgi:hypothetical protein
MRTRLSILSAFTLALALIFAGGARADTTLGTTTQPSGSDDENGCGTDTVINQVTSDPSTPYSVPGPGSITQWQTNVSISVPGHPVTLVVLRPVGSSYTVVGADARSIPDAALPQSIATFPLSTPVPVTSGDTFGLYTNDPAAVVCYFDGGATPAAASLARLDALATPAAGQTLNRAGSDSPGGFEMNLAANFVPAPVSPPTTKKKCKKHKKKRSADSAMKKCKKKKKR